MFNLGSSYFHVALTTVRHLLTVIYLVYREAYPEYTVLDIKFAFNVSRLIALERERQELVSLLCSCVHIHCAVFLSVWYSCLENKSHLCCFSSQY